MVNKLSKPVIAGAVIGIFGLAVYGVSNTVSAYFDNQQTNISGDSGSSVSTVSFNGSTTPGETFCSPYGCAACGGCTSLQYQQSVEELPSADSSDLIIY